IHGARVAVEDDTRAAIRLRDSSLNQVIHEIVGHQFAGSKKFARLLSDLVSRLDVGSQHIAGRDVWNFEVTAQQFGLRTFPGTRRTEQYDCRRWPAGCLSTQATRPWWCGDHGSARCAE